MWLTRLALNNRIAVLMTALMLILVGARSMPEIPVDLFPNLAVPVLVVGTLYPDASPKDVERTITYPMEKTLATVDNVDHIQSDSREGVSAIQVWFHSDEDLNTGLVQSVQKISQILNQLPPGIQQPFVLKFDISNMPVINVVVSNRNWRNFPASPRHLSTAETSVRSTSTQIPTKCRLSGSPPWRSSAPSTTQTFSSLPEISRLEQEI